MALLFSCETEPQTDYVELKIPNELIANKEAVEQLKSDAKQLNKVFNSFEEIAQNIVNLKEDVDAFNETTDMKKFRRDLQKKVNKINWSATKFFINIIWLSTKDYNTDKGHKEIIAKLSKGEAIHFKKCIKHLSVKKDVVKKKVDKFKIEFDALLKAIEEKDELLDRKIKELEGK